MDRAPTERLASDVPLGRGSAREVPRVAVIAWAAISALLLGLASAFDLTISERVADGSSAWALWFQQYGEAPGYVLGPGVGALVLLATTDPRGLGPAAAATGRRFDPRVLAAVGVCLLALSVAVGGVLYQVIGVDKFIAAPVALVVVGLGYGGAAASLDDEGRAQLQRRLGPWRPLALSLLLLAMGGEAALSAIKFSWGRARPYMVLPEECLQPHTTCRAHWAPNKHCDDFPTNQTTDDQQFPCEFSGWWEPHGYRSGLLSFPSGHTFSGWVPLPIALHWTELPLQSSVGGGSGGETTLALTTVAVRALLVLWGITVGASRVFVGAHWCSDTVVASIGSWALAAYLWKRHAPGSAAVLQSGGCSDRDGGGGEEQLGDALMSEEGGGSNGEGVLR
jgi:membrane-associated phospholipid phosphatase